MRIYCTPNEITEEINNFIIKNIVSDPSPIFVKVAPPSWAKEKKCVTNVKKMLYDYKKGGTDLQGWIIWEWPKVLIAAEFHDIWKSTQGEIIDITPHKQNVSDILFQIDPLRHVNLSLDEPIPISIRQPICDDNEVKKYCNLCYEYEKMEYEYEKENKNKQELNDNPQFRRVRSKATFLRDIICDRYP